MIVRVHIMCVWGGGRTHVKVAFFFAVNAMLGHNAYDRDPIPEDLWNVTTSLKAIGLAVASLMGTIPTNIGLLTNLEVIWLDSNSLTGTIPSEFGDLTNVSRLQLEGNSLTGTMPTELGRLENLCTFCVFSC
mmetsp:Transcript_17134/g.39649  ORF Transcript_17134/g.39649 Transcript_17134/m.39649 type:complete len:132 (+) Transcript_17134:1695-2090(+)